MRGLPVSFASLRPRVLFGLSTAILWICAVAGPVETLTALVVLACFGSPGLVLLRLSARRLDIEALAPAVVSGWAISLVCIVVVGTVLRTFSPTWVIAVPLVASVLAKWTCRRAVAAPKAQIGPSSADTPWIVPAMLVGLAFATPALLRVGMVLDTGVNFRPFFNADFFKHLGISQSFVAGTFPPRDLFGVGSSVHYYWMQHIIPGTLLSLLPERLDPVRTLLAVGMFQTLAFSSLLFLWVRTFSVSDAIALMAVVVGIASPSLDGLTALLASLQSGGWGSVAQTGNMEALDLTSIFTSYHLSASTLFRLALYVPQHQLCAVFFLAWAILLHNSFNTIYNRVARIFLVVALPSTSVLMGVPAIGVVALMGLARAWKNDWRLGPVLELVSIPLALILPVVTGMVTHSSALTLATVKASLPEPSLLKRLAWLPAQWTTSFGVMFPLGMAGCLGVWQHYRWRSMAHLVPPVTLLVACLGYISAEWLLPLNQLRVDVELKMSFLFALALVPTAAFTVQRLRPRSNTISVVVISALLLAGLPSVVYDIFWHTSRTNVCVSNPFQSTTIPHEDWRAMQWIRRNTSIHAVFQQSPQPDLLAGGRDVWIPVFAGRGIFASRRGSMSDGFSIGEARKLYDPESVIEPSELARRYGIEYLYVSRVLEGPTFERLVERFRNDTGLALVYKNRGVSIWKVTQHNREQAAP